MNWFAKHASFDGALLALALALGVILNWQSFFVDCLAIDEHVSFWIADGSSPSTLLDRSFNYSATPPLFFILQRLSLDLLGRNEISLRLPGAVCALGAIVVTRWLGRNLMMPLVGGMAAVLLAVHPIFGQFATAGRPYSLGVLLGLMTMHLTARLDESPNRTRWMFWGIANLALIQTHYLFAPLWGAQLVWLVWSTKNNRPQSRTVILCLTCYCLCILSVAPGLVRIWGHRQFLNWTTRIPELIDLWNFAMPLQRMRYGWVVLLAAMVAPIGWIMASGRVSPMKWFDEDRSRLFKAAFPRVVIWFGLPVAGVWLLGRFWLPSLTADRYLVIYLPALAVLLAGLAASLHGKFAPALAVIAMVASQGLVPRLLSLPKPVYDASNVGWKYGGWGGTNHLLLVSSGLTEMTLIPMYRDDPVFHDYVACRVGRMYHQTTARRLSLPMFWTDEMETFYRRAILWARATARPNEVQTIWLFTATDTDLLRATAARAESLIQSLGATESRRVEMATVQIVSYEFR